MTKQDAIRILNVHGWGYTDGELKEATQMAVEAIKEKSEAEEYRTAKAPVRRDVGGTSLFGEAICPTCGGRVFGTEKYCPNCGQAIDWPEVK